ncbi:Uncharacterised protein [Legionella busanensis]|uniref:Uncharacterized protein n=1 Tax=Legionella busanensis TaxID=190655 RepID=A0A378JTQ1_9GAMM|nr:hypothetical protein [Legionella busanensis]STX51562.1 Uncharacterised protein [Legionella busanensis]
MVHSEVEQTTAVNSSGSLHSLSEKCNKKSRKKAASDNNFIEGALKVDPDTGEPSTASNAINRRTYFSRQLVDPKTGKPSKEKDAVRYSTYRSRQMVDPKTDKPSKEKDAIPRSTYRERQKVDPITGKVSDKLNAIARSEYNYKKKNARKIKTNETAVMGALEASGVDKRDKPQEADSINQLQSISDAPFAGEFQDESLEFLDELASIVNDNSHTDPAVSPKHLTSVDKQASPLTTFSLFSQTDTEPLPATSLTQQSEGSLESTSYKNFADEIGKQEEETCFDNFFDFG